MFCTILGSVTHKAEVLISNYHTVRPIAFVKCSENLDFTVKFNGVQVPLRLRHNTNLQFQLVPTIRLNGTGELIKQNTPVVCIILISANIQSSIFKNETTMT